MQTGDEMAKSLIDETKRAPSSDRRDEWEDIWMDGMWIG